MNKKIFLLMTCFLLFGTSGYAQVRVAVTPFETEAHNLRQYANYARGALENIILNFGNVQIVERERMDSMQQELAFGSFSGMTNPNEVSQFGRMAGAQILVTGSILKADTEERSFSGFGVRTRSTQTTATVRVRAYDVESSSIVYSTTTQGSSSGFSTSYGGTSQRDERSAAIEDAINKLGHDDSFKRIFASLRKTGDPQVVEKISIEVKPTPNNCDLEINGVYYGSTPTIIELPVGSTVTITLSRAGYVTWERTVAPRPGMRITPDLEPNSTN